MKHVLILGANSAIARSCAKDFAREGYGLLLAARNTDALADLEKELRTIPGTAVHLLSFDAEQPGTHASFYDALPVRPDIVLCAFGYLGNEKTSRYDPKEMQRIIAVNYSGAVSILQLVAAEFEKRGHGIIAGISSVAGERGKAQNSLYSSAKAGFTAYLSGLRNRLFKKGVHVLTIKPGYVYTPMTAGLPLPGWLTASADEAGTKIVRACLRRKNVLYVRAVWRPIMFIIRHVPEFMFKKTKL